MVRFEDDYEDCKKMFEDEGYKGVWSIYQTDEAWIFFLYLEEVEYGAFPPIIVMRDGSGRYYFVHTLENIERFIDNAVKIR